MPQIGLTPEVRELKDKMKEFINGTVIPAEPVLMQDDEESARTMAGIKQAAKDQDLWALGHPLEIGGAGLGFMPFVHLNEVIGRSHFGSHAVGSASMQDSIMMHLYASEDQKAKWLAPMVAGEIYPSVGLTEPEVAGSDPTLMQTRAVRDGDEWVINGHKWFTSGASRAAFTTCFAMTNPEAATKWDRFSSIIVPTDTPGYEIVRAIPTMGTTQGQHCEVKYHDVRVPATNLLGPEGKGFLIAQKRLGPGRIFHCMRWLGQAERAFELMCERAKARWSHGSYLAEKGDIRTWIADSAAEIQAARMMTLDAARAYDDGDEARVEIGMIKFWGGHVLHNVIDRAIQVHGALGVTSDTPLEFMYREARYARLYDGPDEVHKMTVARHVLRDPVNNVPWR